MKTIGNYQHWRLEEDAQTNVWATIDTAGTPRNMLSAAVMSEFAQILDRLDDSPPAGLVIRSGKPSGFIVGADISEFVGLDTPEKARDMVARGWNLFNRLAKVAYPTLALVRGDCLGGGFELALACRYILTVDEPGTKMGLPEVMLGLFPAWGGMLRLPERIGPTQALDMMLIGKTVDAVKAKCIGLADECVPARVMENAARMMLLSDAPRRKPSLLQRLLNGPLKPFVVSTLKDQVSRRYREKHYPAPFAIIDIWAWHRGNALKSPPLIEKVIRSDTARNLVRMFFLRERLKGFDKDGCFKARHVHVVGAGVMGGDIAAWCALWGLTVTLQDLGLKKRIAPALERAYFDFRRRIRGEHRLRAAMDRLIPDPEGHGAAKADVVIEAVYEDLETKRAVFRQLEAAVRPDAVLATNTSNLMLEDLRTVLSRPERLIGIHFFNPVAKMPLIEIVSGKDSDPEMVRRAVSFVRQIDHLPLPVRSSPGFLVNAVLVPYMLEAMRAVDEGYAPETVDEAMLAFDMPMGPIELIDMVGLDVTMAAGKILSPESYEPPRCLLEHFNARHFGKKIGRGFYYHLDGKTVKVTAGLVPVGLGERLVKPLLERTRQLVEEGVVADADLADAGVILGTGFAPFTGGPLNYLKLKRKTAQE